ncbi:MAPEG family protein [Paracoccus sp. IB05]|uniref:MAPEG family protein n=1 Tax=Paracoccus sp. IB05 TaxID=2779367 RepID=UPI0018E84C1E|nr:MAPEG family protein [Paracoccus sp. IB05]MBJ2150467.1 MAPEG family protein [Paracoccus sp. IB05]
MTSELSALVIAILLQAAAIGIAGAQMNRELGLRYNAGPRDKSPEMSPRLGRLRRAVANGFEGLAMFAPLVLVVVIAGKTSALTAIAAWVYVLARLAYIPAYALAWSPWRSVIWLAGFLATILLAGIALFAGT